VAIEEDEARRSGGGGRIRTEAADAERGCEGSMWTEEGDARKKKRIDRPIWWTRLGAIARVRLRLARMGISSTRVGAKGRVRLSLATTGVRVVATTGVSSAAIGPSMSVCR
jgi:hypothetical protein